MRITVFTVLLMMLFVTAPCLTQEEHPIDKFLEDERAKDWTTAGMNNTTLEAMKKWEVEMNKYYKLLTEILDSNSKAILESAQAEWVKFRNLEFMNIDNIVGRLCGILYATMAMENKNRIVRERALKLKEYYEMLNATI